jgi:hypothetical protein
MGYGARLVVRVSATLRAAREFLVWNGASEIRHPGGLLLAHLERTRATLEAWGAAPALELAGLCHATYGTDGFPRALIDVTRRDELRAVIGSAAEAIVYAYGSCDRAFSYPHVAAPSVRFRDRFTGRTFTPPPTAVRAFAELSVANELDVMRHDLASAATAGSDLVSDFRSWHRLLSTHACAAVEAWARDHGW